MSNFDLMKRRNINSADMFIRDSFDFREAIKRSDLFLASQVLKRGFVTVQNTEKDSGWYFIFDERSSIFYAVQNDDLEMLQFLLENGHESDGISRVMVYFTLRTLF